MNPVSEMTRERERMGYLKQLDGPCVYGQVHAANLANECTLGQQKMTSSGPPLIDISFHGLEDDARPISTRIPLSLLNWAQPWKHGGAAEKNHSRSRIPSPRECGWEVRNTDDVLRNQRTQQSTQPARPSLSLLSGFP
jgi:hypothetical protein